MKNIKKYILFIFVMLSLQVAGLPDTSAAAERLAGVSSEQLAELEADLRVPGHALPGEPGADAAICYRGGTGFVISPPEGWVNLPEQARKMGLCVVFVPAGHDFDSAPAVIYPNLIAVPKGEKPIDVQADKVFRQYLKHAEGKMTWLEKPGVFFASCGLEYELRYFRNGPPPKPFEMVAYHVADNNMFMVVLSAAKNKNIQAALPGYMKMLYGVFSVEMTAELKKRVAAK